MLVSISAVSVVELIVAAGERARGPFSGGGSQTAEKPARRRAWACVTRWSHQNGAPGLPPIGDGTPAMGPGAEKNPCSRIPILCCCL